MIEKNHNLQPPDNERASRLQRMSDIIHRYDVNVWGQDFLSSVTAGA